jgi:DNA-binding NarL/FixJ family response regulator
MFSKVLIADDLVSINTGVHSILDPMGIARIDQVNYCDDAFLKILAAIKEGTPYELLITDLSFKTDHREQKIKSGDELAIQLKATYPHLKIIVYTIEEKPQIVRHLILKHQVDGYVCKGRQGLQQLTEAVEDVYQGKTYVSPQLVSALHSKSVLEIDDYDIELLKQLANGLVQDEIAIYFKEQHIKPASLSAVEKRLGILRNQFDAKNGTQLIAKAKDLGLI